MLVKTNFSAISQRGSFNHCKPRVFLANFPTPSPPHAAPSDCGGKHPAATQLPKCSVSEYKRHNLPQSVSLLLLEFPAPRKRGHQSTVGTGQKGWIEMLKIMVMSAIILGTEMSLHISARPFHHTDNIFGCRLNRANWIYQMWCGCVLPAKFSTPSWVCTSESG